MRTSRLTLTLAAALLLASCTENSKGEDGGANTAHATDSTNNRPVHEESGPAPTDKPRDPSLDSGVAMDPVDAGALVAQMAGADAGALAAALGVDGGSLVVPVSADAGMKAAKLAEVEFSGLVQNAPKDSEIRVVITKTACPKELPAQDATYISITIPNVGTAQHWETEIFVPQGSTGWVCGYATKSNKVVATANSGKQLTMQGEGEVVFADQNLNLKKK